MERTWRWIVAILAVIAILALLAFARGHPPGRGEPTPPPAAAAVVELVS
jgi:predicted MFS family arabinose efflux permease